MMLITQMIHKIYEYGPHHKEALHYNDKLISETNKADADHKNYTTKSMSTVLIVKCS